MKDNRIAALRREAGMNQRELGQRLGVGQTTISAWETGRNEPDYAFLRKMAELFCVSIDYLMGYVPDNGRRGLTKEEYDAVSREFLEEQNKRRIMREIQLMQEQGLSQEEYEQILLDEQERRYHDESNEFFETFQIKELFEYLNEEQRQRVVNVVNTMFPNASKGLYTDEITRQ